MLVVGLIMLTVMTLLAVSSMQSSGLQELMSNNMKDKMTAFEAAESAIRSAEAFLDSEGAVNLSAFDDNDSDGLLANLFDEAWNEPSIDWTGNNSDAVIVDVMGGVTSKPRYIIQYIGPVVPDSDRELNVDNSYNAGATDSMVEMFKITARGTGGSDSTVVVLEAMYGISN
ncbi:MAG: PilX N-terminal domain-containing pilus assembly protein [Gammaproteobacteria bacterium]|nr:PilX N-terminal domain-containing pilus assembly protein [Gammaproteobacteria bacterium]